MVGSFNIYKYYILYLMRRDKDKDNSSVCCGPMKILYSSLLCCLLLVVPALHCGLGWGASEKEEETPDLGK